MTVLQKDKWNPVSFSMETERQNKFSFLDVAGKVKNPIPKSLIFRVVYKFQLQ